MVSIHTPHAGSDTREPVRCDGGEVSIHTPHAGSDPFELHDYSYLGEFQSTLPMQGVTGRALFQFVELGFQSTLPMQGVTQDFRQCVCRSSVSIHTPHAGSDTLDAEPETDRAAFQSTLPMQGVTWLEKDNGGRQDVSIHTPHAGSDLPDSDVEIGPAEFQSTLPMQGVTLTAVGVDPSRGGFNPHSPCRE